MRTGEAWKVVAVALLAACADGESPAANVHVDASGDVVLFDGDVRWSKRAGDGTYEALFDGSGGVSTTRQSFSSPSSQATTTREVDDVQPGDFVVLNGSSVALPADCSCALPSLISTGSGTSWNDPDPSTIAARVYSKTWFSLDAFGSNGSITVSDGELATSIPYGTATNTSIRVSIIKCIATTWDDLRDTIAVADLLDCATL